MGEDDQLAPGTSFADRSRHQYEKPAGAACGADRLGGSG